MTQPVTSPLALLLQTAQPDNAARPAGPHESFDDTLKQATQPRDPAASGDATPPTKTGKDGKTAEAPDGNGAQSQSANPSAPDAQWLAQWAAYAHIPGAPGVSAVPGATAAGTGVEAAETSTELLDRATTLATSGDAGQPGAVGGRGRSRGTAGDTKRVAPDLAKESSADHPAGKMGKTGKVGKDSKADDVAELTDDKQSHAPQGQTTAAATFSDVLRQSDRHGATAAGAAEAADPGVAGPGAIGAQPTQTADRTPPTVPGAAVPVHGPELQERMGEAVRWMAGNGVHTARINVSPDSLGPITVHLRMEGDMANIVFTSTRPETRHELEASMNHLRDALSAGGMNLGQASVGSEQQHNAFAQDMQQNRGRSNFAMADGPEIDAASADAASPLPRPSGGRQGSGLVNLYA